jgi:aerobic carbon-monoxide dehydrogenase small subunit
VKAPIVLNVNGRRYDLDVPPQKMLLKVLRDDLELTGTKYSCGSGDCGTCVVEIDGRSVNSCITLAVEADGCEITTVEGLAAGVRPDQLDTLQKAFVEAGAVQCGYCTPGYLMTARAFLRTHPDPTDEEIRETFEGNICRCTGYVKIKEAILNAAATLRGEVTP